MRERKCVREREWQRDSVCERESGRVGEWESGRVGEWGSGRVGEWERGRVGEWERECERESESERVSEDAPGPSSTTLDDATPVKLRVSERVSK